MCARFERIILHTIFIFEEQISIVTVNNVFVELMYKNFWF